ncbi:OmpA family protein [Rathayibacter sp. Leaf296]|uniref:OmpA family protein n=1 Tax=Rathayibacter sp. Leaf296 TaxID=1736327 RepID=UPI0007037EEA|nr:OmpA family protein [Rathayibacter sp. Leaf296]KQQ07572.1 hypothetical protein ASF46_18205 [Rathayibacter sp. Leaf296]
MSITSTRLLRLVAATAILPALVTGCSSTTESTGTEVVTGTLSAEALDACTTVLGRTLPDSQDRLVIVSDRTVSVTPEGLPPELTEAIVRTSENDGSVSVVAVDGADSPPELLAENAALSTEGPRDRPSVGALAAQMPRCVEEVLLARTSPTSAGTDLHRALALASELSDETTDVWLLSDFVSTAGPFTLDEGTVAQDAAAAAERIAAVAPLDLHGADLHVAGAGNTSEPILTANREWLRDLARSLCSSWNAKGCEAIETDPAVAAPVVEGLPADPIPAFPALTRTASDSGCVFEAPASITFAGSSARLREDAASAFDAAVALMLSQPTTSAIVVGHTASTSGSTHQENLRLSTDRARAVMSILLDAGVDPARLTAVGVGDTQPRVEDLDSAGAQIESAAATERRVDIVVSGTGCSA